MKPTKPPKPTNPPKTSPGKREKKYVPPFGKKRIYVLIDTSQEYGLRLCSGLARAWARNDALDIIYEDIGTFERKRIDELRRRLPDALVVRTNRVSLVSSLAALTIPFLNLNEQGWKGGDGSFQVPEIHTDERALCVTAVDHFYGQGIRRLVFYHDKTPLSFYRQKILQNVADDFGIHVECCRADSVSPYDEDFSRESLLEQLEAVKMPIGIWALNDLLARRCLLICQHKGIAVPENVALLGTGNFQFYCKQTTPQLSSIDLLPESIGYEAGEYLVRRLTGKTFRPVEVPVGDVVRRESSNLLAVDNPEAAAIIHYIQTNATRGIKVSDVQKKFDVIPRTLQRIALKYLGHTLDEEIRLIKLRFAKELLSDPNASIHEVAELAGYSSTGHFARSFVRDVGICPKTYQRTYAAKGLASLAENINGKK